MDSDKNKPIEVVLIDADIFRYELGSLKERHPFIKEAEMPLSFNLLEQKVHERIDGILNATGTEKYEMYLTGSGNWRFNFSRQEPYKGTRTAPKPANWQSVNDILHYHYSPEVVEGAEADDKLAKRQKECQGQGTVACIASRDKDLDTVHGWRYRWKAGKQQLERKYFVSELEATQNFYKQILTGDEIDNIPGCSYRRKMLGKKGSKAGVGYMRRYGIRGADSLIESCTTEKEMYQVCLKQYEQKFSTDEAYEIMLENARLLHMGSMSMNELYNFPQEVIDD